MRFGGENGPPAEGIAVSRGAWGGAQHLSEASMKAAPGSAYGSTDARHRFMRAPNHIISSPVTSTVPARSLRASTLAYVQLTKPRIIELLLVTTVPAMVVARRGVPGAWVMATTVIGGALAAGGANAMNCYVDRDIDEVMVRTKKRPLPTGRVEPARALVFGVGLEVVAFATLALWVNLLAAALALSATVFYVVVYTMWLKRTTTQNIVIGGAAGAVPVLVGWAAITDRVGAPSLVMFAVVFLWTPPHFWALAVRYRDDYRSAGVPMLPAVRSLEHTARQILVYAVVLVAVTLLLGPIGHLGVLYMTTATVLGSLFIALSVRLLRSLSDSAAMRLFAFSITYLALLFAAMAADALIR